MRSTWLALPWLWNSVQSTKHPALVVQKGGAPARSEPHRTAKTLARLDAGQAVELRDALRGWVKVESDGRQLWVREDAIFDLIR